MDKPTETDTGDGSSESNDHVRAGNGGPSSIPAPDEEKSTDNTSSDIADDEDGGTEQLEDEEDDAEDTYDDEDDEPALKYERVGGAVPDLLKKDTASALAVSSKLLALGTHAGIVHVLDMSGKRIKSYKPHLASVTDIDMDATADFLATASLDGQVVVQSLSTTESYAFDMKRPMRTVAMEPGFAKRSSRAVVCGGLAGTLVLREKGWLGHRETVLHSGEGPIWQVRWKLRLIAWANDVGVKIYDTASQTRIASIDRPPDSPRADLFKCTLHWQDDTTLLIAWADNIKVARIRTRPTSQSIPQVDIIAVFQVDCMLAGILPHPLPPTATVQTPLPPTPGVNLDSASKMIPPPLSSFLILAYDPPDTSFLHGNEMTEDRSQQKRRSSEPPQLRIISRAGEELSADALPLIDFHLWGCNDYVLAEVDGPSSAVPTDARCYVVLSPRDIVIVKPRDERDHVEWLVERRRYEEALEAVEKLSRDGTSTTNGGIDAIEIGQKYIQHLVSEGDFAKAAQLCPKVCAHDSKRWEDWIFIFAQQNQLNVIIPFVPTGNPRLDHLVYEMVLAHLLTNDRPALLQMIKTWPKDIYDIGAVIVAVRAVLDKSAGSLSNGAGSDTILIECLAELYTANRQPGKALPYFMRLRRPNVFDLIRENNLFTDVQDQVLLLVDFDHELMEKRKLDGQKMDGARSEAIKLLVDHIHSIPIGRVVQQLQGRPYYLFLYLDALFERDPHSASGFADTQVQLYAEFATTRLIDFLRASSHYSLEKAYNICKEQDRVPEMVFLLGRMGNNKVALTLIIERLGDVHRAIDFAKEQNDDDLWEDLLKYSETRPAFIRGLLENVGAEIDPIRLIRRIKNGLEIPGLQDALIKILQDFHLQISLLEGCHTILNGDCSDLARKLQKNQTNGFFLTAKSLCPVCSVPLQQNPQSLLLLFLCRHVVHAPCASGNQRLSLPEPSPPIVGLGNSPGMNLSGKIAFASMIRPKFANGCPICHKKGEGDRLTCSGSHT